MKHRLLIADDEIRMRKLLAEALAAPGREVLTAKSAGEAWRIFQDGGADFVITDLRMESEDAGLKLLEKIHSASPETPSVLLTAFGTIDAGVRALSLGAVEYMVKPVRLKALRETVDARLAPSSAEPAAKPFDNGTPFTFDDILIGMHPGMRRIHELLPRIVSSQSSVLILGESGTGKEVFAKAIHEHGPRSKKPFVRVNCAALVESLLESELFGIEKGVATEVSARPGKFELADGGSILLDEIGDMAAGTQAKVLRVLQEKEVERVGGRQPLPVDVRIIAATHRDLEEMVREGTFRQDLFFRLNVISLELPPLRERLGDLELYVSHFLKKLAERTGREINGISPDALGKLSAHSWPGNVRELENTLERAMVMASSDVIETGDLPDLTGKRKPGAGETDFVLPEQGICLDLLEKDLIGQAMDRTGGNKSAAARLLGLTRRTLGYRLEKHGLGESPAGDNEQER